MAWTQVLGIALRDIAAAAGLLTRLPIRVNTDRAQKRGAAAAWAYPLVGAGVGGASAAAGLSTMAFGASPALAAGVALSAGIVMTGALHEDGLADSADGFWGGWSVARRLEIMKDSRIGTYGVLALILSVLLRWALLQDLIAKETLLPGLSAAMLCAQATMVVLWASLPSARPSGLAASVGQPERTTAALAATLGAFGALMLVGWATTLLIAAMMALVVFAVRAIALDKIGGHTGDVLGAAQQIALLVCLGILGAT